MSVGAYGFSQTDYFSINTTRSPVGGTIWIAVCEAADCSWQAQSVTEKAAIASGWNHLHAEHPKQATPITKPAPINQEGKQQ